MIGKHELISADEATLRAKMRKGSLKLLKAHFRTGQHWITDPVLYLATRKEFGL